MSTRPGHAGLVKQTTRKAIPFKDLRVHALRTSE